MFRNWPKHLREARKRNLAALRSSKRRRKLRARQDSSSTTSSDIDKHVDNGNPDPRATSDSSTSEEPDDVAGEPAPEFAGDLPVSPPPPLFDLIDVTSEAGDADCSDVASEAGDADWSDVEGWASDAVGSDEASEAGDTRESHANQSNASSLPEAGNMGNSNFFGVRASVPDPTEADPREADMAEEGTAEVDEGEPWERDLRRIKGTLLGIKFSSNVADAALEKLFSFFCDEAPALVSLLEEGHITKSYRRSIRPADDSVGPTIRCNVTTKETVDGASEVKVYEKLKTIPNRLLRPRGDSGVTIVTSEAYTTLEDIVAHYVRTHPHLKETEELQTRLHNCQLSIDGVRESQKSSRHLYVVTIMVASDVYIWKILNPLKKDPLAVPSAESMLRYDTVLVGLVSSRSVWR